MRVRKEAKRLPIDVAKRKSVEESQAKVKERQTAKLEEKRDTDPRSRSLQLHEDQFRRELEPPLSVHGNSCVSWHTLSTIRKLGAFIRSGFFVLTGSFDP